MRYLHEQLPLAVQLRDDATFDNFVLGENGLLVNELRRLVLDGEDYIYLYGASGSGRSHLLQAACRSFNQQGRRAIYLPLYELQHYAADDVFAGVNESSLICLDDIDAVVGKPHWEEALFYFFNQIRDADSRLVIAAPCAVRELSVHLADLASRLSWGVLYQLKSLNDDDRIQVLRLRAEQRGLELNDEVSHFIYYRCQRDMVTLMSTLDRLDHASLKEQRRLTIPFVKSILSW